MTAPQVVPSLDGCLAKIDRAQEHLHRLEIEIGPQEEHTVAVWAEPDKETGEFLVKLRPVRRIDLTRCSLLAGEIIYNLRCSLEYLMYEAIALDTGRYFPKSQFPIITKEPRTNDGKTVRNDGANRFAIEPAEAIRLVSDKKSFEMLTPAHQAIVAAHQPYSYGWGYHFDHPLGLLGNFSNQDKHRLQVVTYHSAKRGSIKIAPLELVDIDAPGGIAVSLGPADPLTGMSLGRRDPDTQIIRLLTGPPMGPNPRMYVQLYFVPEVTLDDQSARWGSGRSTDLIQILHWMGAIVTKIVREFEPDFG